MSSFWPWLTMILLTVLTNISTAQHPSCINYRNISEPWRNVGFCSISCNKSDSNLKEGWYRFIGVGGDQVVSSCASALNNKYGNITSYSYNLFTCNSSINYTDYMTCNEGFTVYFLRPTKETYATRHSSCSNSSSCGEHAQCGTVYGSCVCDPGLVVLETSSRNDTYGCKVLRVSDGCQTEKCAQDFLKDLEKLLNNTDEPLPQKTVEFYLGSVMNITSTIKNFTDDKAIISYGNNVLSVTEKLVSSLVTPTETQNMTSISLSNIEAQVFMVGNQTTLSEIPPLNASGSSLKIDLLGISKNNNGSAAVVFMSYTNMSNILKPSFFKTTTSATKTMLSNVVSATLPKTTNTQLTKPVNFTLKHNAPDRTGNLSCVYWKETEWVEDGCSITEKNRTQTVCSCVHLSTFALIMMTDPDKGGKPDDVMELINTVAVSVGLVFLILTILTLAVCQRGPKLTNAALINLCVSLFLAHLVFLLTQHYLENIKKSKLCVVLAGVIHFLFLSAFVWMFIEAVLLYIFVKNLSRISSMQSEVLNWKCMIVIGYVIPLAMVGVTSGLYPDVYGDERCWLKNTGVWIFLGPVSCILA
ncbi:adhesion G protein-coupled receptor E3-like isoform X2 [Pangasianodon hypophthalmus]|nr:adhesion G protein-coupled receptor E3-like isoform X2 [Pangasianodon hypophthalmus]